MKVFRIAALTAAALLLLATSAAWAGGPDYSFSFSGKGADAFWQSTDSEGVMSSTGIVFEESSYRHKFTATDYVSSPGKGANSKPERGGDSVVIFWEDRAAQGPCYYDEEWGEEWCEYTTLSSRWGIGFPAKNEGSVAGNLGSANINTVLYEVWVYELIDFDGDPWFSEQGDPITIAANWKATGPRQNHNYSYRWRSSDGWETYRGRGAYRPASIMATVDGDVLSGADEANIHQFTDSAMGTYYGF